jgi:hypothetical protein
MVAWLLGAPLVLGLAGACPLAARADALRAHPPSPNASAKAVAHVTDALTGKPDASALAPEAVCAPPSPGRGACYAQALAVKANGSYVHPSLAVAASPVRFFAERRATAQAAPAHPAFAPADATAGQPQPGTPAYLQQAYDLAYLSQTQGAGDTVAVVDAYDDPSAEADLATYRAAFGLPACTTANGCFRKVNQSGQQASYPVPDAAWAVEISLDLDSVSALCPQCHIVLVEANSDYTSDLQAAQATAARLAVQQISDSWGAPQANPPSGAFTFAGVATVAAAGDSGYVGAGQSEYPAALAGVTAAGGTTLTPTTTTPRGFSEAAWAGAGSGCDTTQAKPSWQSDSGCAGRSYDDLSADADPATGIDVYDSGQGSWIVVGGTSEATPLIAAYYAITGAAAQSPSWAYQHQPELNDASGGSNGACPSAILYICSAGAGYDGPTGEGSISGAVVGGGPGIGGPGPSGSYATGATQRTAQLQAGIYSNGSDTQWSVQYGTTTAYGQHTAPVDVGAGTAPVSVSAVLSDLAPGALYHYRLVAQNAYGTTYGYDGTVTTATPPAPTIASASATVSGQTATLAAVVDPQGSPTTLRFQYGTTIALGQSAPSQTVANSGPVSVSVVVSGLAAHTTYYYQLFAGNAGGATASTILSFATGAAARPPTAQAALAGHALATVAITRAALAGRRVTIMLTCQAAHPCRTRVRLTVQGRLLAHSAVTVPTHRTFTTRLALSRRALGLIRAHRGATRVALLELLRGAYRPVTGMRVG